jgi:hypothetical protein
MSHFASISAVVLAVLLAACDGKTSAASADAGAAVAFVPACSPAPTAPPPSARPDLREPRVTSLSRRPSSIVDVVAGRPADPEHPAGTVYVAAVLDNESRRGEATLFEWDLASAAPLDPGGMLLYRESDKVDNGRTTHLRIAAGDDQLFAAVTLEPGGYTDLTKANVGHPHGHRVQSEVPPMRNVSLETDGRWLAVAYELPPNARRDEETGGGILLYDGLTLQRMAKFPFSQSREAGVRYDILEIIDGRLYAAEINDDLHVVELTMPLLQKKREAHVPLPKDERGRGRVQLTRMRDHLIALTHHTVIELTSNLEVVGTRELHATEVALGPGGQMLTPLGLEVPGKRGDYVADVRASASCTPFWAGAYPLLACSVDMEGARVARLAPR